MQRYRPQFSDGKYAFSVRNFFFVDGKYGFPVLILGRQMRISRSKIRTGNPYFPFKIFFFGDGKYAFPVRESGSVSLRVLVLIVRAGCFTPPNRPLRGRAKRSRRSISHTCRENRMFGWRGLYLCVCEGWSNETFLTVLAGACLGGNTPGPNE